MIAANPPMPADGLHNLNIAVSWEGTPWPDPGVTECTGRKAVRAAFDAANGRTVDVARKAGAELSLVFADNAFVQTLNRNWRGRDAATNVLSFPAMGDDNTPPGAPVLLGDVVVAREVLFAEAKAQDKAVDHHLAHLVCHGTLHLLQYDHMNDTDAAMMESLETIILAELGIPDPYISITPEQTGRSPRARL